MNTRTAGMTGIRFMRGNKAVQFIALPSEAHAKLAAVAIREMRRETVQLPRDERACVDLLDQYERFISNRDSKLRDAVAQRVADEDVQEAVLSLLLHQVRRGAKAPVLG